MTLGFKLFYALLMTGCAMFGFYRSCRLEEENGVPVNINGRIYIWLSPLVFPITIVMIPLLWGVLDSSGRRLQSILPFLANIFLFLSIYYLVLLCLLPFFRKIFSAKACAVLWMIPVFVYYLNVARYESNLLPWFCIPIPKFSTGWILPVWICGFMSVLIIQMVSHLLFRRQLMSHASKVTDEGMLLLWKRECRNLNLNLDIPLFYCDSIQTPLSMGIFKRSMVTLLPDRSYTEKELHFLFLHELHHIQRSDVETKIFLGFCKAFCWFNPFVWIAVKKASEDLELSCDEVVLQNASEEERKQYAELLLKTADRARGYTTCLSASASALRYRLKKVVTPVKRKRGVLLLGVLLFFACMADGLVVFAGNETTLESISLDEAAISEIETVYLCTGLEEEMTEIPLASATGQGYEQISYLQNLKLQKIYTSYEYEGTYPSIDIAMRNGIEITIMTEYVCVRQYSTREDQLWKLLDENYYRMKSELDWTKITEER